MSSQIAARYASITKLESELRAMAVTEKELTTLLNSLRASMQDSQSRVDRLRELGTTVTIDLLSTETLTAIFQAGLPSMSSYPGWGSYEWDHAIRLSQVSRHWRDIVISTPSLWSSIYIRPSIASADRLRLDLIRLFLERSRTHPLDIFILLGKAYDFQAAGSIMLQMCTIAPYHSRFRGMIIYGHRPRSVVEACASLRRCHVPLLKRFEVVLTNDNNCDEQEIDEPAIVPFRVFEGGAPLLTYVKIDGLPLTSCYPPLSSVTSLHLSNPPQPLTINEYCEAVVASKTLTNLHVVGPVIIPTSVTTLKTLIPMTSLRSLTIIPHLTPSLFLAVAASLGSPALESLTVIGGMEVEFISELGLLVQQPRTTEPKYRVLQSLSLHFIDFTQGNAYLVIEKTPTLTHISLQKCKSPSTLLELLLPSSNPDKLLGGGHGWPRLRVIEITPVGPTELDTLCMVVSYRMGCGKPIEAIKTCPHQIDTLSATKLTWLRKRVRISL